MNHVLRCGDVGVCVDYGMAYVRGLHIRRRFNGVAGDGVTCLWRSGRRSYHLSTFRRSSSMLSSP